MPLGKRNNNLKTMQNHRYRRLATIVAAIFLIIGATGCRSSKKHHDSDNIRVETIEHKKDKDKDVDGKLHGLQKQIVEETMSWIGTPYKYASCDKGKGTDCSGMVWKVYDDIAGVKLPRNSRKQAEFCHEVKEKSVKAGDLVFFATGKDPDNISHVGIMIDGNRFVHASTKKGVIISEMETPYYRRTFMMYGRVL